MDRKELEAESDRVMKTLGLSVPASACAEKGPGLMFYRCVLCQHAVSRWDIRKGGCAHCGGTRIVAANLSFLEKMVQIILHPKIWRWKDEA